MTVATALPLHPLALLLPELPEAEHEGLTASIAKHGQLTPATSWVSPDGVEWLIDGRHRARACEQLGVPLRVERLDGDQAAARAFVLGANVLRRHLTPSQRAAAASALATRGRGESGSTAASLTQTQAAAAAGVSERLVRAARTFATDEELTDAVIRGELTVTEAERRARGALRLQLSRESETQEWLTPWSIVEGVVRALGCIDGDPCAEPGRRIPASWHLTEDDDALRRSWENPDGTASRVFLNPPWDRAHQFVRRLLAEHDGGHVEQAVVLLPARLGSDYVTALTVRGYPRVELTGRLKFEPGRGATRTGRGEAHFASMLVGVGVALEAMHEAFGDQGVVVQAWATTPA
ncbi:DNA N-6-adenine-methyltransferase [Microbacterium sp.]|uniref:DNA N-6-adenine-methyltransferase n=1 Tax=Microbacterium sp. TaxID=51671 RepID=UPI002737758B|nr:DNA N-6-adenine-methyltransferase [Microbacterium sp.]MDP3951161.1 DNA N-6-adenine-methyltransferase [Microbacterium sp.]